MCHSMSGSGCAKCSGICAAREPVPLRSQVKATPRTEKRALLLAPCAAPTRGGLIKRPPSPGRHQPPARPRRALAGAVRSIYGCSSCDVLAAQQHTGCLAASLHSFAVIGVYAIIGPSGCAKHFCHIHKGRPDRGIEDRGQLPRLGGSGLPWDLHIDRLSSTRPPRLAAAPCDTPFSCCGVAWGRVLSRHPD
jgi:hypothetical protein